MSSVGPTNVCISRYASTCTSLLGSAELYSRCLGDLALFLRSFVTRSESELEKCSAPGGQQLRGLSVVNGKASARFPRVSACYNSGC